MLKITTTDNGSQRTLVLEGKLIDPWVGELERSWVEAQRTNEPRPCVIDLKDGSEVRENGEKLLSQMMREGATYNCCRGVLTRHVVKQLERRRKEQSRMQEQPPRKG